MERREIALEVFREFLKHTAVKEWQNPERLAYITAQSILVAEALDIGGVPPEGPTAMANEFYIKHGTEISFGSEVGDDVAWTMDSQANAGGQQSAFHDQGAEGTARPLFWQYRIVTQAQATPTVNNALRCFLKTSNGTYADNSDGTTDTDVTSINKLLNLEPLNSPIVDEAAANVMFVRGGMIPIPHRYFGVVGWNAMGATVTADEAETKALFTPLFWQGQ